MTDHDPAPDAPADLPRSDPRPTEPTDSPSPEPDSGPVLPPAGDGSSPDTAFLPLDPRVVNLWRLDQAVGWGIFLLLMLGGAGVFYLAFPETLPWTSLAGLFFMGLSLWFIFAYPGRAYHAWGYRIDGRVLEIRSGLFVWSLELLPLTRIQHVDLQRGPLERMYGLASLVLHTAGTRSAAITLPGLDAEEAVRLRDHLLAIGGDDAV